MSDSDLKTKSDEVARGFREVADMIDCIGWEAAQEVMAEEPATYTLVVHLTEKEHKSVTVATRALPPKFKRTVALLYLDAAQRVLEGIE